MFQPAQRYLMIGMFSLLIGLGWMPQPGEAAQYKVLVVMSYDETYPFETEIREGLEAALTATCELTYVYLNTKKQFEGGPEKAQEAYALYQQLQPDGVIAADDDAQAMFVVPYLKDQVTTPVMFCGVNAEPEKYGYPAANVSGILERGLLQESLVFARQIVPSLKTFGQIALDTPTSQAFLPFEQIAVKAAGLEFVDAQMPKTLTEALTLAEILKEQCDIILLTSLQGLLDEHGHPMTNRAVIARLVNALAGKPTLGSTLSDVEDGALCAVIQSGQEQGRVAAEMLLQAMRGTPVAELPITRNKFGRRVINLDTLKALGIKPKTAILRNAEFVTTPPVE